MARYPYTPALLCSACETQAVFEPCGVPGGVQVTLIPWAVIGLVAYTAGYPVLVMLVGPRFQTLRHEMYSALCIGVVALTATR